jgi:hypothetical protein
MRPSIADAAHIVRYGAADVTGTAVMGAAARAALPETPQRVPCFRFRALCGYQWCGWRGPSGGKPMNV